MMARTRHNAGFTLAEVMLAVAIILVLGAIAFPSVITTQNNMRILELSNAAEAIANAAQTQMTAKKADGTWLAFINNDAGKVKYDKAHAIAGTSEDDTYYMVASKKGSLEGARTNGIVPSLSVDETVRSGDYVIVFKASTASVVSVYYTDGKAGFFGSATSTTAAQKYYEQEGGATDQATRMKHTPMIGYYEGTPAGATNAVALANPVIWVDDETGRLCVQNPNTGGKAPDGSMLSTATSLTITKKANSEVGFTVAGFDESAQSFIVKSIDGTHSYSYFNIDETKVYELISRTPTATSNDVFAIDLNELSRVVQADSNAQGEGGLAALIASFMPHEELLVEAEVSATIPSVPATAKAFIQWPAKVAQLAVLITNPALDSNEHDNHATAEHIKGTYAAPKTQLVTTSGGTPVTDISMREQKKTFAINTHDTLKTENVESSRQAYSGGWVQLDKAYAQQANVRATVGSYTPEGSTTAHEYQIYEIWINGQRVGYVKQNKWTWEATDLATAFRACIPELSDNTVTEDLSAITIDTKKLYESAAIDKNADGGYEVYIRTTPKLSEVERYFASQATAIAAHLTWEGNNQGVTGARGQNRGGPIRKPFENEFGAASTVATWTVATRVGSSVTTTQGGFPRPGDLRVYYSATPAVAWNPDGTYNGSSQYTAVPSCVLWLFERQTDGTFAAQPAAFVRESRLSKTDNLSLAKSDSADFEIPYTRDYLFYRVLEYCDQDGKRLEGSKLQYVPYSVMDDKNYASISAEPDVAEKVPTGWLIDGKSTWPQNKSYLLPPDQFGTLVGDYDDSLAYGYVQLKAQYKDKPKPPSKGVGFMYVEFSDTAQKNLIGYHGYYTTPPNKPNETDDVNTLLSWLPTEAGSPDVASWEYRAIVPSGSEPPNANNDSHTYVALEYAGSLVLEGNSYDSYRIVDVNSGRGFTFEQWRGQKNIQLSIHTNSTGYGKTYTCNLLTAAAVASPTDFYDSQTWGSANNPWRVRAASQIMGYRENVDEQFAQDVLYNWSGAVFRQERDIDMSATQRTTDITFSGIYNGQGYFIKNYQLEFDLKDGENGGLFVEAKNAQLSGMHLTLASTNVSVRQTDEMSIGFMVGKSKNTAFSDCSVTGAGGTAQITIEHKGKMDELTVGLLVGEAKASSFDNCAAANIAVRTDINSPERCFGGLIGVAEKSNNQVCVIRSTNASALVSNVSFELGKALGRGENAGSLVGRGAGAVDISGIAAGMYGSNVVLITNSEQSLDAVPVGDMP